MQLATFAPPAPSVHPLAADIRQVVRDADRFSSRSMQVRIGPSEVGERCARKLAYRIMDEKQTNHDSDPWAAIVGTATHAWLADAFHAANKRLGRIRYLIEQRLEIAPGLIGSCDLFDGDTLTVVDHKVLGTTTMREYKTMGPPPEYRKQAHLYGKGYLRLGLPVREVALVFYPRSGLLSGVHVWSEPFDEAIADEAIARLHQITEAAVALDVEHRVENYRLIPREPAHRCTYCPWFKPGADMGDGCPGHMDKTPATSAS